MNLESWLVCLLVLTLAGASSHAIAQPPDQANPVQVLEGSQRPDVETETEAPIQAGEVEVEVVELANIGVREHPNANVGQRREVNARQSPESGPPQQNGRRRGNPPSTFEGVYMLYGVSGAFQTQGDQAGLAIGMEVSRVYLSDHFWWYGAYADLRYSSLVQGIDLSVGVEGGWAFFGLDVGLYTQLASQSAIGLRARGCLTSGIVSFCGGGGFTQRGGFAEVALLLKYPGSHQRF